MTQPRTKREGISAGSRTKWTRRTQLYSTLHHIACDRKDAPDHECVGRLVIDRAGVTMSCALCGDSRRTYKPNVEPITLE